jgi:hypothetical protein
MNQSGVTVTMVGSALTAIPSIARLAVPPTETATHQHKLLPVYATSGGLERPATPSIVLLTVIAPRVCVLLTRLCMVRPLSALADSIGMVLSARIPFALEVPRSVADMVHAWTRLLAAPPPRSVSALPPGLVKTAAVFLPANLIPTLPIGHRNPFSNSLIQFASMKVLSLLNMPTVV